VNNFISNFAELKNVSIHIGIITLFCLGFFMMPSQSFACSKHSAKTEQKSCHKEKSKDNKEKDCCKTKSCKKSKKENGHCSGNCNDKSCNSTSYSSMGLPIFLEIKTKSYFADAKKQKFGFKEAYYSSGYSSIWLPPKIS